MPWIEKLDPVPRIWHLEGYEAVSSPPSSPIKNIEGTAKVRAPSGRTRGSRQRARPIDLANYLRERAGDIAETWTSEIASRELGQATAYEGLVERFMTQHMALLPWLLGPHATHIQPLWDRTAELFGSIGAKRGLAAGEVIEEFQILRYILIRQLYREPPPQGPISLRDTLRLNRIVDRGIVHASVGHTDALFFQFLEANETPVEKTADDIVREAETQLTLVEEELAQIVEVTPVEATSGAGRN